MITLEKSVTTTVVNNEIKKVKVYNIISDTCTLSSLTAEELHELDMLICAALNE